MENCVCMHVCMVNMCVFYACKSHCIKIKSEKQCAEQKSGLKCCDFAHISSKKYKLYSDLKKDYLCILLISIAYFLDVSLGFMLKLSINFQSIWMCSVACGDQRVTTEITCLCCYFPRLGCEPVAVTTALIQGCCGKLVIHWYYPHTCLQMHVEGVWAHVCVIVFLWACTCSAVAMCHG